MDEWSDCALDQEEEEEPSGRTKVSICRRRYRIGGVSHHVRNNA